MGQRIGRRRTAAKGTASRRRLLAGLAVLVAALAAAVVLAPGLFERLRPIPAIGGPFTLIDQNGRTVTRNDLLGHPAVMAFGYTYCPDVCPTTLTRMTRWIAALGPTADRMSFSFVTVDPARDTPDALKDYLSSFDPHIRGLTGSENEIAGTLKAYRVFARKVPSSDGSYTMDHTAGVYLIDAAGRFRNVISFEEDDAHALEKLRKLAGD
ncbi:MAG: SCO family protein [Hyphomicrobiaceae bacterium]